MNATRHGARRVAALVYAAVSLVVVAFQVALGAGAPWGEYAMGGASPGQLSPGLRVGVLLQAALLAGMAAVVLACAGVALHRWRGVARRCIWVVLGVLALSLILNLITPSSRERAVWAPVGFVLVVSCAIVALVNRSKPCS